MHRFRPPALHSLAVALVAALAPVASHAEGGVKPPPGQGPSTCSVIATGGADSFGQVVDVQGGASITCRMPGGTSFSAPPRAGDPPPLSGPCLDTAYQPLSFTDSVSAAAQYGPQGTWSTPSGKLPGPAVHYARDAGITDYWAVYQRPGTFVNGSCHSDQPWPLLPVRFDPRPHPIRPPDSPVPDWRIYVDQARANLKAAPGHPGTLPRADQGLVNLAQCYWLDGLQHEHDQAVTLEGPPDPSGRHIRYTLLIRASLGQVEWDFGDGDPTTAAAPLACGSHDQLVAHVYRHYGDYVAVAHEHWTVRVDLYWVDSDGPHRVPVDAGPQPPPIDTPPQRVHLGQIEGVPG